MAYATQSDLVPLRITQKELVELTCDDASATVSDAVTSAALEEASGTVDSYCRQRYTTPLQQSDMVTARTLDIATYILFSRRRSGVSTKQIVRQRYEDAIQFLKDISAGKASLDQPATASAPQTASASAVVTAIEQKFDDANIRGYV